MSNYKTLSKELEKDILNKRANNYLSPFAYPEDCDAVRRRSGEHDKMSALRTPFIRDTDKILNCPYYNRYSDKTQVFSLYKNDDITHRSLHVQLVSRIARTIGKALGLNLELIEAIALGHDIGHTPFGHTGERFLDELYSYHTNRRFEHNVHSVRVLDTIYPLNLTLPTLSGILAHNGEIELNEYKPQHLDDFAQFDEMVENCYKDRSFSKRILPSTLEGCVMRISDIIAYLGKDRQDAEQNDIANYDDFTDNGIGIINAEIVNNLIVNIVENSYQKDYVKLDESHFSALTKAKDENYSLIYKNERVKSADETIKDMMGEIYEKLLSDYKNSRLSSPIFTHHVQYISKPYYDKNRLSPYTDSEANQVVVDYIASMTDDYFIELHTHLFPKSTKTLKYVGYFE